ncbi:MAG TPA: cytochrome ubiquinol oxidase subunit I, partial [Anaerolineaceae bacterium]|nr:cytochrome ubiquinol oxidase subunit I [Anaerolineaceae bacterium]
MANQKEQREVWSLRVPYVTSILMYNRPYGEVRGINDLQKEYEAQFGSGTYYPNVMLVFYSFRLMVAFGFLLLFAALLANLWLLQKKPLEDRKWLAGFPFLIALPYICNTAGWIVAESGRQPWVVWGLLKTQDAVSPNLTPGMVLTTIIGFAVIYSILMAADVYLMAKYAKRGAGSEEAP